MAGHASKLLYETRAFTIYLPPLDHHEPCCGSEEREGLQQHHTAGSGSKRCIKRRETEAHETKSVCFWMLPDVFRQISAGHPFGNELERGRGNTDEGDDVLVFQALPHHGLFEERL